MRRAFVIFLFLLFPLNVLALSMSASTMQAAGANEHVVAPPAADSGDAGLALEAAHLADIDPDKPPPGTDLHDSVSGLGDALPTFPAGAPVSPQVPLRHGLAPYPPIKPPPVR